MRDRHVVSLLAMTWDPVILGQNFFLNKSKILDIIQIYGSQSPQPNKVILV